MTISSPVRRARHTATGVLAATALALSGAVVGAPAAAAAVTCTAGVLCEAEAATLSGGAVLATNHGGFTGAGFVAGLEGTGSIAFGADAIAAGAHEVTIRYANGRGGDNQLITRTMTLVVNGTNVPVSLPTTGDWGTWGTVTVPVTLQAGANALDLRVAAGNDGRVNVDSFRVDAAAAGGLTCALGALCEAEAATLSGGAVLASDHQGYTGSGFVAGLEGAGSIAFGAAATTAGAHELTIRYANGLGGDGQQITRTMTLVVNGTAVPVSLPTTGSWGTWGTVKVPVTLRAGANALDLRVAAGNDGRVNVDSFRVDTAATAGLTCAVGVVCEAEAATLSGGAVLATDHLDYTGAGFVAGLEGTGSIAWRTETAVGGDHTVRIRYANGGTVTRSMTLSVNGTAVPVTLPPTGDWDTWSAVTVPVSLSVGGNALDLHVAEGDDGRVNIDNLRVDEVDDGTLDEPGVSMRLFDVGFGLQELCELKPGQTPNIDVLRPNVNWVTPADWEGMTVNYVAQVVADLKVPVAGSYTFRLVSDDGSRLSIGGQEVVDHDGLHGATAKDGSVELAAGTHALEIDYFQAGGGAELRLQWQRPGQTGFELVPTSALRTEGGGARVVAPGVKECEGLDEGPGDGLPLAGVHPSFTLSNLRPDADFQPDVSGMSWFPNGDLAVLTWGKGQVTTAGKLYRVTGVQDQVDLSKVTYTEIATDLKEPQGVQVIGDDVYVATKVGLDKLVDATGDGFFEGRERLATWPNGDNFHEFAFGLPYKDGYFYIALSVALERSGNSVIPQPAADRGTVVKIDKDTGAMEYVAGGLRTPNGMGWGSEGELLITDNQGGWVPASKLVEVKQGAFYNHPTTFLDADGDLVSGRFDDQPVTQPLVWMPHNEIANAPSTPVLMEEGLFAGQLAIGDVTYGGVQRVFLEEVEGQRQGALYRMSQGLEAGVNEMAVGPDGDLYIGGIGYDGNWNQPGKLRYGLQKLTANETVTMDILKTEITETGFDLTYTKPLSAETAADLASRYQAEQWRYNPTSNYGGPKIDQEPLVVEAATLSADGRTVSLTVPGVEPGRVVHLTSPRPFSAADGQALWSTEVWYTANVVPGYVAPPDLGYYEAEEAALSGGAGVATEHSGYSGSGFVDGFGSQGATLTFRANAPAEGVHPVHIRYANGPNPFDGTKQVSLHVNGTEVEPLVMPRTGDWKTWRTVTRQLALQAGANTITLRFEAGDDGNVNVDALKVGDPADICAPTATEEGWTSLFDGTLASLDSWRMAGPGSFGRQADCSIRSEGGLGLLWYTAAEFSDYSLKLDWKLVKDDNGGVFVGFPNPGNDPFVAVNQGYEIQIDATDDADSTTGAVYDFRGADAAAVAGALKPVGSWNSYEIQVQDQTITVLLNGVEVNRFTSTDPARDLASGFIGVQNHGGGETVSYRNIRIKGGAIEPPAPTLTVTLPGSYQSELGCPGDWQPECLVTEAKDADGDGVYTYSTTAIPAGAYEVKAAHGKSWDENYGAGGVRGGSNIPFEVATAGSTVTFSYTLATHVLEVQVVAPDSTPPTTSATTDPALNAAGWATTGVRVTLSAQDAGGTVAKTEHSLDAGQTWTTYTGPVPVFEDGEHVVQYRSVDVAGNVEQAKSLTVGVDRVAPALTVSGVADGGSYGDSGTRTLSWTASDRTSGLAATSVTLDGAPVAEGPLDLWTLRLGEHVLVVTATDVAGHTSSQTRRFTTTTSVDDLLVHVERARTGKALSAKDASDLVGVLDKAKVAAAKGKTADAAKAMGDFLVLVKDTKKTVTDEGTRALLVRDGEAVRTRYAGA